MGDRLDCPPPHERLARGALEPHRTGEVRAARGVRRGDARRAAGEFSRPAPPRPSNPPPLPPPHSCSIFPVLVAPRFPSITRPRFFSKGGLEARAERAKQAHYARLQKLPRLIEDTLSGWRAMGGWRERSVASLSERSDKAKVSHDFFFPHSPNMSPALLLFPIHHRHLSSHHTEHSRLGGSICHAAVLVPQQLPFHHARPMLLLSSQASAHSLRTLYALSTLRTLYT